MPTNNIRTYFLYLNYYATGEGMHNSFKIIFSESKEEAIERFVRDFVCKDIPRDADYLDNQVRYWSQGVDIYDIDDNTTTDEDGKTPQQHTKEILSEFLVQSVVEEIFCSHKFRALHELEFGEYRNYS